MPTNEERREAAARLRNYANLRESFKESPICGFINALGFSGYLDWKGVCSRLADLIEPEPVCIANITITAEQIEKIKADVLKELEQPERNCRMEYDNSKRGVYCSYCGARMDVYTWDHYVDGTAGYLYPFCYWCGARVVQE